MLKVFLITLAIVYCHSQALQGGRRLEQVVLNNNANIASSQLLGLSNLNGLNGLRGLSGLRGLNGLNLIPITLSAGGQNVFQTAAIPLLASFGAQAAAAPVRVAAPAAVPIQASRTVELLDLPANQQVVEPQIVQVRSDEAPVVVHFQTSGGQISVEQSHTPAVQGEVQVTRSEDQPYRVVHEVLRPVIQEIREIIQPYRRITQEVLPVEEHSQAIVSTAAQQSVAPQAARVISAPAVTAQVVAQPVVRQAVGAAQSVVNAGQFQFIPISRSAQALNLPTLQPLNYGQIVPREIVGQQAVGAVAAPAQVVSAEPIVTAASESVAADAVPESKIIRAVFMSRKYHESN